MTRSDPLWGRRSGVSSCPICGTTVSDGPLVGSKEGHQKGGPESRQRFQTDPLWGRRLNSSQIRSTAQSFQTDPLWGRRSAFVRTGRRPHGFQTDPLWGRRGVDATRFDPVLDVSDGPLVGSKGESHRALGDCARSFRRTPCGVEGSGRPTGWHRTASFRRTPCGVEGLPADTIG